MIADLCIEHDVLCISDEVYEHLVFEGQHIPIATLPGMRERTITMSSIGKTFSLTGWKIGWAAAPPPITAAIRAAHQFITFAVATPLQHAAATALGAGQDYYVDLAASYRRKRDYLARELTRIGFEVRAPAGTYFLCAGFRRFSLDDDVAFCRQLIATGVAAIPPSVFYENPQHGKMYVRFAFCKRDETLQAAVQRLERLKPA
jgi:N-succinyldiaminopimelate aminotransferase